MDSTNEFKKISDNIKKIQQLQKKIIEQISNIDLKTRSEIIHQNYEQIRRNTAPWFEKYNNTIKKQEKQIAINKQKNKIDLKNKNIEESGAFQPKSDNPKPSTFEQLLEEIKIHPDQKTQLIHQILFSIKDLDEEDRLVLETNYLELPKEKLIDELMNLKQLFELK
ncbi:MAG: hypothetical protein ACTSWL_06630 [Promethearchaeota archaeon]